MRACVVDTHSHTDDGGGGGGDDDGGGGGTHAFAAKPAELINSATDTAELLLLLLGCCRPLYVFMFVCVCVTFSKYVCVELYWRCRQVTTLSAAVAPPVPPRIRSRSRAAKTSSLRRHRHPAHTIADITTTVQRFRQSPRTPIGPLLLRIRRTSWYYYFTDGRQPRTRNLFRGKSNFHQKCSPPNDENFIKSGRDSFARTPF